MRYIILLIITLFNIGLWLAAIFILNNEAALGVGSVATAVTFVWLYILSNELDRINYNKTIKRKE